MFAHEYCFTGSDFMKQSLVGLIILYPLGRNSIAQHVRTEKRQSSGWNIPIFVRKNPLIYRLKFYEVNALSHFDLNFVYPLEQNLAA